MATHNVCKYNKFGYCRFKDTCRNFHSNEICEKYSCNITSCNQRHPRECRYYREYRRCKFNPCKFKHVTHSPYDESEILKLREDHLKSVARLEEIEKILNERNKLENTIKNCNDRLEAFENQIQVMEQNISKNEREIDLMKNNETDDKNLLKKRSILQRLVDIEEKNVEKDKTIEFLSERVESLEGKLKQVQESENNDVDNLKLVPCEYCDFSAKNQRGLKLHMNAKHEVTKVELTVYCKATEKYLNSDRDSYKKEIENEIDVLEDVIDMDMNSSKIYDYVGKFLPTKIVLRTRIPAKWESCENFRKEIWEIINKRIPKGKISEDKEGKD